VWRMEQGGLWPPAFGCAQEPPLSSRWYLLIGTGYNCRRPLRSCKELPVLSQLGHGVRLRRPLLQCWAVVAVGVGWAQGIDLDKAEEKKDPLRSTL
jgi:hypothetical protein